MSGQSVFVSFGNLLRTYGFGLLSVEAQAAMDILMIVFILFVMLGVTFDLSRTIHRMLMLPLER
eukprot:5537785-Amphidinium_carterae.1